MLSDSREGVRLQMCWMPQGLPWEGSSLTLTVLTTRHHPLLTMDLHFQLFYLSNTLYSLRKTLFLPMSYQLKISNWEFRLALREPVFLSWVDGNPAKSKETMTTIQSYPLLNLCLVPDMISFDSLKCLRRVLSSFLFSHEKIEIFS